MVSIDPINNPGGLSSSLQQDDSQANTFNGFGSTIIRLSLEVNFHHNVARTCNQGDIQSISALKLDRNMRAGGGGQRGRKILPGRPLTSRIIQRKPVYVGSAPKQAENAVSYVFQVGNHTGKASTGQRSKLVRAYLSIGVRYLPTFSLLGINCNPLGLMVGSYM